MLRQSIVTLVLLLSSCGAQSVPQLPRGDLLVLEQPRLADARADLYMATLATIFADEQGAVGTGCLQVLILREEGPEELVFIDCLGEVDGRPARVIRLVARQSVSDVLATSGFDAASKVGVRREETDIPLRDSRRLRAIWLSMLRTARPSVPSAQPLPRYQFSACKPLHSCLAATTAQPQRGTRPDGLARLAELLARVPNVPASYKDQALRDVRAQATALERELGRSVADNE